MEQRVSLVTLGVADLARARAFYEGLGWTTRAEPEDDVVFFQAAGMVVALWSRAELAKDSGVGAEPERMVMGMSAETFWGGYSGVFVDPEGHPWEVVHNPRWTLSDDGAVALPG